MFVEKLGQLRRPASSEPAALEGGLGKDKLSMIVLAVSGSVPFCTSTKWKRTALLEEVQTFRRDFRMKIRLDLLLQAIMALKKI